MFATSILILGLLLFLGSHSIHIFAADWRSAQISRLGEPAWKGLFSLGSGLGFGLLIWGFSLARTDSAMLWLPPQWARHATALLALVAFVLLVAAYVPKNRIKAGVGHPMVLGVAFWSLAHLISNGRRADLLLFGAFFLWAVLDFRSLRRRDALAGTRYPAGTMANTLLTVLLGAAAFFAFAVFLHARWLGVRPF